MAMHKEEYLDVRGKAESLGLDVPNTLAFLPMDFEHVETNSPLRFAGESTTLQKLFRERDIVAKRLSSTASDIAFVHNKSHDWLAPVIFVGAELLKSDPNLISACIDVLRDRVLTLFGSLTEHKTIKASVVIERSSKKSSVKVTYEGKPSGLEELAEFLKAMPDD